jgi:hypothetical protein
MGTNIRHIFQINNGSKVEKKREREKIYAVRPGGFKIGEALTKEKHAQFLFLTVMFLFANFKHTFVLISDLNFLFPCRYYEDKEQASKTFLGLR